MAASGNPGTAQLPAKFWTAQLVDNGSNVLAPASNVQGGAGFDVPSGDGSSYAAFLLTDSDRWIGNDTGRTVSASFSVLGANPVFAAPDCGDRAANARFILVGDRSDGVFDPRDFWWSNPASADLAGAVGGTQSVSAALDPANWSDFNGELGNQDGATAAAFADAVAKVSKIGLSFGSGCYFSNGVSTTGGSATFVLRTFDVKR